MAQVVPSGQWVGFPSSHLPVPLHVRTGVRSRPLSLQPPTWQMVPAGYTAQSPATSQRPVCWQLAAPLSMHLPRGSWAPPGTGRQRPGVSGNAHDRQAIVQSDSQQTPSTQCPVRHSDPRLHAEEVGLPVVEVGGGSGGGIVGASSVGGGRVRRAHHDLDGLHHPARDQHVGGAGADRRAGGERGRVAPHLASVERVRQIDEGVLIAGLERAGVAARRRGIDDDFARRRPRHAQPELVVLQRPEPHVNVRARRLLPAAPDGGRRREANPKTTAPMWNEQRQRIPRHAPHTHFRKLMSAVAGCLEGAMRGPPAPPAIPVGDRQFVHAMIRQ